MEAEVSERLVGLFYLLFWGSVALTVLAYLVLAPRRK